ncbi:histamine H2 receptor-like [Octopus sinensis]|uniref:Histamine H2 receptor-like n=1 Tax=Octopus sinensis TaxID=2607531 RepID=A0A6P7SXK3_9MOLL|nr:histamine H2 receptor-like [Octopus sinensis]
MHHFRETNGTIYDASVEFIPSNCTKDPMSMPRIGIYVAVSWHLILGLFTMLTNGTILAVAIFMNKSNLQPSHFFIINLALTDFCGVFFLTLFHIWRLLTPHTDIGLCGILFLSTSLFTATSVWSIAVISLDRYRLIVKYHTYRETMTPMRCKMAIGFVWAVSSLVGFVSFIITFSSSHITCIAGHPMLQVTDRRYVFVLSAALYFNIGFLLPTVIIVQHYFSIMKFAWKREKRFVSTFKRSSLSLFQKDRNTRSLMMSLRYLKTARILSLLVLCYAICFFPYFLQQFLWGLRVWNPWCPPLLLEVITRSLLISNALFNPFFYGFLDRYFQQQWQEYICNHLPVYLQRIMPGYYSCYSREVAQDMSDLYKDQESTSCANYQSRICKHPEEETITESSNCGRINEVYFMPDDVM